MIIKEEIKKGAIIKVKVPNVENPIKALVLDVTEFSCMGCMEELSLICYAQKRLFKVSYVYGFSDKLDDNHCTYVEFEHPCQRYEGIIADYCEIPNLPVNI